MSRPVNKSTAERVEEQARGGTAGTTRFRRHDTTVVFERGQAFGSIGDYDLVQQLGRCTFVAHHRLTRQAFTVRLLDPLGHRELLDRQLLAARAIAAIDHPNVVRTIEVGVHEGRVYLVMEYLRGRTLGSVLEMYGAPPMAQAIRIGMHVARGLEAAHLRGVIHRNVDADAVFIVPTERGRSTIKVADFELEPHQDVVRIARHSMSPEVCRGGAVDHRSDLYSLGVLLHRVCTLKNPFEGTPIEILAMYRFRSVVRPEPSFAGVPPELAATIRCCLAEDPAARYRTAAEVLEALRHAADGQARRERPDAAAERSGPSSISPVPFDAQGQGPTEQWSGAGSSPVPVPIPGSGSSAAMVSGWAAMGAPASAPTLLAAPASAPSMPTLLAAPGPGAGAPKYAAGPSLPASAPTLYVPGPDDARAVPVAFAASRSRAQAAKSARAPAAKSAPVQAAPTGVYPAFAQSGPAAAAAAFGPRAAQAAQAAQAPAPAAAFVPVTPRAAHTPASSRPAYAPAAPLAPPVLSLTPAPAFGPGPSVPAVPEWVDRASDTSGVLLSPSGPARVATAVSMDPTPAQRPGARREVPWKPIGILAAAVVLGSVLSLATRGGSHEAPSRVAAAPAAAPAASTSRAGARAPAAAAAPASAAVLSSQLPSQGAPGCVPGAPALVPDVVLSVGAPAVTLPNAPAGSSVAAAAADEASRKAKRKAKRKAVPAEEERGEAEPGVRAEGERPAEPRARTEDERPAESRPRTEDEPEPRPRADESPVSGETIVVPDEAPRKRSSRRARPDRGEREERIDL